MPITTFVPPMRPTAGTTSTPEVSLRKATFGDGYTQAAPNGLNHIRRVVSLSWEYLTMDEAKTIETFMRARGGYEPFYYTLNGDTVAGKWTCETWSLTDGIPAKFTATFKESFNQTV